MAEQVVASGPEGELMTVDWRSDDWSGGPAALHGMVGAAWRAGLACLAVGLLGCSVGRVPLAESEATVEDGAGVEKGRLGDGEGSTAGGKLPWRQALSEWRLAPGSQAAAGGRELSLAGFDDSGWLEAAVPGTVVGAQGAAGPRLAGGGWGTGALAGRV